MKRAMAQSDSGDSIPCSHPSYAAENIEIIRLALMEGLIDPPAAADIARRTHDAPDSPVGFMLIREGILGAEQLRSLISKMPSKLAWCPACNVPRATTRPLDSVACVECGSPLVLPEFARNDAPSPLPSADAGRYEFIEELGRGNLGRVLAGKDRVLGREVAIKEMRDVAPSEESSERFLREGHIAGRLTHPHIVPVFDVGIRRIGGESISYFVMARIVGRDLGEIITAVECGEWESVECGVSSVERRMGEAHAEHSTLNTEHSQPGAKDDPRKEFSRNRLLRIFQDVCLAMVYAHDHGVTALYLNLLTRLDKGGKRLAWIEEPGTLVLRTFRYDCDCLKPVRNPEWQVQFGQDAVLPWRDGRIHPGMEIADSDVPVPETLISPSVARYGHGEECSKSELTGVEISISRCEERDFRLIPGPEVPIGKSPIEGVRLERGSYLCKIRKGGFEEVRLPVHITRGGRWEQDVNLYRTGEIPDGFRYIPGGPYIAGGRKAGETEEKILKTEDFFMARLPVTLGDYIEFLNSIESSAPEEARLRQPREGNLRFLAWEGGLWRLPAREGSAPLGLTLTESMPAFGISWFDAMAFCAWKSTREGRIFCIPHEQEWETAARGVDGRIFPWGYEYEDTYSNTNNSHESGPRICETGSFPADESPYGIMDLAGNMATWCFNSPEKRYRRKNFCMRGGSWRTSHAQARAGYRYADDSDNALRIYGFRLVLRSRAINQ